MQQTTSAALKKQIHEEDLLGLKPILPKLTYMCGSVLAEYVVTGTDRDEYFKPLWSKIELPHYPVEHYLKICIHCEIGGTNRTLGNPLIISFYYYCIKGREKPDVIRRKEKCDMAKKEK